MTRRAQIDALSRAIDKTMDEFREEFDLDYASVIGVLQVKVYLLCQEADRAGNDDDHDPE